MVTYFTSHVHMKEKEHKADIEALANNEQLQPDLVYPTESIYLCKNYQNDSYICKPLRYFCTFFEVVFIVQ